MGSSAENHCLQQPRRSGQVRSTTQVERQAMKSGGAGVSLPRTGHQGATSAVLPETTAGQNTTQGQIRS